MAKINIIYEFVCCSFGAKILHEGCKKNLILYFKNHILNQNFMTIPNMLLELKLVQPEVAVNYSFLFIICS